MYKKIKFIVIVICLFLGFQILRNGFEAKEIQVRNFIQLLTKQIFPKKALESSRLYGLKPFKDSEDINQSKQKGFSFSDKKIIVLVHGLDEPGLIWMDLEPALFDKGFDVYRMIYPNDQSIHLSSKFFCRILSKSFPSESIILICHSMGGLVVRNMLTHPEINYESNAAVGKLPIIKRVILIAPPNHGSQLARLRILLELRDQIYQWSRNEAPFIQFLLDGTGVAGVNLIPGSTFLNELNTRTFPPNITVEIIAGKIFNLSNKIFNVIGDGLVSLDSARLDKIPLTIVEGNHMTIIRNIRRNSKRVPPAIPIIIDRLLNNEL